jgi:predicted nucleotidyltransferase
MRFGLKEETIAKINSVFAKYPEVEEVIIYGSRAKDTFRTGSDIDITLKGKQLNDTILSKVYWDIDDLNTPYLVDISIFDKLNSTALEEHINRVGKVFYSKQLLQEN